MIAEQRGGISAEGGHRRGAGGPPGLDRIGDRGDDRAVEVGDVLEVLDTHHPAPDEAIADGV